MLAAAYPEPVEFGRLAEAVGELERLGLAGFGWGVAWVEAGRVSVLKSPGRFIDEGLDDSELTRIRSRRFLVHLRRPSRLSTVSMADTQPFAAGSEHAWCHNGFLARAEELRGQFSGMLHGQADSEVGWAYFRERLAAGDDPVVALKDVDAAFGGTVNLGYLGGDGELAVYHRSETNWMWQFELAGGDMACTSLHSSDESVFDLVFPQATERRMLADGSSLQLAGPLAEAA